MSSKYWTHIGFLKGSTMAQGYGTQSQLQQKKKKNPNLLSVCPGFLLQADSKLTVVSVCRQGRLPL